MKLPAGASAAAAAAEGARRASCACRAPRRSRSARRSTPRTGASRSAARPTRKAKKLQSGQFFRGRFTDPPVADQARRSKKLITELRLTGSSFKKACKAKASISAKRKKLEEARAAPVRQRQGLVPHQRAQRGGDRPRHALERPGPLRRHAGDRPARPRRGPRQGQAQDGHRADRATPTSPGSADAARRLRRGWARSSSSRRAPARPRPPRARASPAPRSCWAAAASPAASTRSARCGRSTCCRSTARVNQFDIYVGTSAGSLIAALAANGDHARADDAGRQRPGADAVPRHQPRHAAAPELPRVRRQGRSSCRCTCSASRASLGRSLGSFSHRRPRDRARRRAARRASTRARGSRSTCARCSPTRTAPTTSACSQNELYLAATDLDTCERIVLGAEGWDDVPISTAVRASTALPMVYEPHRGQGPRAGRRRHRLDHQPRHRGRGGREVHRRRQPARARTSTTSRRRSRRCSARACAASRTWASRRSATRRSSCSPTSACTRWRASGRSATRASTSS